ncbi:MAG: hypothetical protein ACTSWD_05040, partial [Candidatus Heimdallarchaeota archaeon]
MALMDNAVGAWNLDESSGNLVDAVSANNGTYNGALYSQTGKINTAIGFDGTDDEVSLTSDISLTGDFTVQLWMNADATNRHLFVDENETGANQGRCRFDGAGVVMGSQTVANKLINDGTAIPTGAYS